MLGSAGQAGNEQAQLEEAIASGLPVLVAFYSQSCSYCKADEPVLENLQKELDGALVIVRIDVGTQFGKQLAQEIGVRGVPTYFLLDTAGESVLYQQTGPLRVEALLEALLKGG